MIFRFITTNQRLCIYYRTFKIYLFFLVIFILNNIYMLCVIGHLIIHCKVVFIRFQPIELTVKC